MVADPVLTMAAPALIAAMWVSTTFDADAVPLIDTPAIVDPDVRLLFTIELAAETIDSPVAASRMTLFCTVHTAVERRMPMPAFALSFE